MASQADGLLVHRHLVGENGRLRQDPAFIDGRVRQNFLQLVFQAGAVIDDRLAASGLHLGNQLQNGLTTAAQVVFQSLALGSAHSVVLGKSLIDHAHQVRLESLLVHLRLFHGEHIRHPGKDADADIVPNAVGIHHLAHGGQIPLHHRGVQSDLYVLGTLGAQGDEHIHLAPGNGGLHRLLYRVLREGQDSRQLHRAVQVSVIDGAQLHGVLPAVDGFHCPAVAGHALNHGYLPLFRSNSAHFPHMP